MKGGPYGPPLLYRDRKERLPQRQTLFLYFLWCVVFLCGFVIAREAYLFWNLLTNSRTIAFFTYL